MLACVGRKIHIEDISPEDERMILTTLGRHRLRSQKGPNTVKLLGTGHFVLDSGRKFKARVIGQTRLELFDELGNPLTQRVDSSMGELHMSALHSMMRVLLPGPFNLPAAPIGLLLVAVATVLMAVFLVNDTLDEVLVTTVVYIAFGLVARLIDGWLYKRRSTSLSQRVNLFQEHLQNPNPKACERGPDRAITASKLFGFYQYFSGFIRDRTMYYIDPNIVRPITSAYKLSFAERVGPSQVQWFISHWWGTMSRDFCSAIQKHAMSTCTPTDPDAWMHISYWICTYSNNQYHIAEELGKTHTDSSFYKALHSDGCRGTCMILDEEARPLTRSWCL